MTQTRRAATGGGATRSGGPAAGAERFPARRLRVGDLGRRYGIVTILLAEIAVWFILSPNFLTLENFTNVARQASVIGVVAVGMTLVIITSGIDLSVGSLVAFAGILATGLAEGSSGPEAVPIACAVGLASGLFVGVVIVAARVPPFIATLAMLAILQAATLLYRGGAPVTSSSDLVRWLGAGYVGPIPVPVLVLGAAYLAGHWVLSATRFGRHVYAIGGNERAARSAGIRVERHLIAVYAVSGGLAGVGAVLITGRLGTATPLAGEGLELDVIAAVIVGGTSLFGGVGTLWGTLAGVFIIAFLRNGLTLMDVSGFWQLFATGTAVLAAVLIDRWIYKGKE